jgi:RNA polymerase sigma-54 factor
MAQYLSQIPIQQMRMEQRLTPQLIQSMEILQLPVTALEARIQEELERNPALEMGTADGARQEDTATIDSPPEGFSADPHAATEESRSFDRLERLTRQYDFDPGDQASFTRRVRDRGERDTKLDAMANTPARALSLQEYLANQWSLEEVDGELRRIGDVIISYLEDDGYLRTSLEVIAESTVPPLQLDELEKALLEFQRRVDPPGIGARSIQESLLLQLKVKSPAGESDNCWLERVLLETYFEDLKRNRLPEIAEATGRSIEEVKAAIQNIGKLDLAPGYSVVERQVPVITPDVIVEYAEDGDGYDIRLARGNSPKLRVSGRCKHMLQDASLEKNVREYLRKNVEAASALVGAIQYRRERLLELARVVVERQRDFFEMGPQALKVLRMSDLAEHFKCDPSTVSRTVAGKYMQTPRGIFALRDFFTGGTETASGKTTSWDAVRARVREIIDSEDKSDPLSDEQIAKLLQKEKLDVKRRTIAKYRQQLNIPSARQRKQF